MARRTWTVSTLAEEAGLDVEQTLLTLWGEGIEYPDAPSSRIRASDARAAEAATGVIGDRRRRVAYWEEVLQLSRAEVGALLEELGFSLNPLASNLPKGAIRRLADHQGRVNGSDASSVAEIPLPPAPPFEWSCIGQPRELRLLEPHEVLLIHQELEEDFVAADDPISPPGVKSMHLLESAVDRQNAGYGGERKYTSVASTAAALLHSIVQNHPFHNGNKRTALVAMLVLLDLNGMVLESNQDALFRWMLNVAGHKLLKPGLLYDNRSDRETFAISEWIHRNSRAVRRSERIVTWIGLQRILKDFECEIRQTRGERMEIIRHVEVKRRGLFGGRRTEILRSTFLNTSDGRDVPRRHLKRIREELRLDERNGVDSEAFYGKNRGADDFIVEYSKLLRRLAKV